jgi:hypothetical protein
VLAKSRYRAIRWIKASSLLSAHGARNNQPPAMRVGNPILLYNKITFLYNGDCSGRSY